MKIIVLQEDIDKASLGNPRYCPIANAIRRQQGWLDVSVFPGVVVGEVRINNEIYYTLSEEANDWARRFDRSAVVQPFAFDMYETETYPLRYYLEEVNTHIRRYHQI